MANNAHHKLLFGVRRSIRYHSKRQAFFERIDRWLTFALLLLGSGSALSILQDYKAVGLAVTCISSLKLVFAFGSKANRHAQFVKDFTRLEKRLYGDESAETVAAVTRERLDIESAEPPVMHVLNDLCHNELLQAMGYDAKTLRSNWVQVGWHKRLTANFFNWGAPRLVKAGQESG